MILIKNATVITSVADPIENGQVLFDQGKIVDVGTNIDAPQDCKVIDAQGGYVMPGMIDAHCHIGMWEDAMGFEGSDGNETTDPATPQLRAIDAINPMDRCFRDAYQSGVTCACTGPGSANVIGGTFTVIKTKGKRIDNMIVKDPAAMKVAFGENPKRVYSSKGKLPSTRMGTASVIREYLFKASEYKNKKDKAAREGTNPPDINFKLESLVPVIERKIPLKAHAHRADDIFTAIRVAKEFNLKLTLDHCTEGHLIADELAKESYPALVGPSFGQRSKVELREKSFETCRALAEAGVKIAIITDHPVIPLQYLPLCAAYACKEGLDELTAFQAITKNPAEILGVSDRVGTLEKGKDADIAIFDRHPFDVQAKTTHVFIDGEEVYTKE